MKDLKIDLIDILYNEDKKQEAVLILNKIGYKTGYKSVNFYRYLYACGNGHEQHQKTIQFGNNAKTFRKSNFKEITLAELREMVKTMKEYLMPSRNYEYILTDAREGLEPHAKDWISIPEGAEIAIKFNIDDDEHGVIFYKNDGKASASEKNSFKWDCGSQWSNAELLDENFADGDIDLSHKVLWQRPTQPEALPFIDDNPQSLCEQYAEIEQVRQAIKVKSGSDSDHAADAMSYGFIGAGAAIGGAKDNVNHPSHYTQGKVECIDALESATIGKSGIEAVCVANVIKYLWRYEEKNGLEDVKKAKFYLNRLLTTLENNNG